MSIKTPRLIRDRCGVYYFRLLVPKDLRVTVGKLEWRRSLRTKDAVLARYRALVLSTKMEEWMTYRNSDDDWGRLLGGDSPIRKSLTIDLERGYFHADTPEEAMSLDSILKSLLPPPSNTTHATAALPHRFAAPPLPVSRAGVTLEEACKRFLDERRLTLAAATLTKQKGTLRAYVKLTGNLDIALAGSDTVSAYKQSLVATGLAASTINDHLSVLRGFFEFCIGNKIAIGDNPVAKMLIKGANNQTESYEMFDPTELAIIFNPPAYKKAMKTPDFYWGPLLALFTGGRAEELASLELSQFISEDGVELINIRDGKTKNAKRKVPIHKTLIGLGLLDYVEILRGLGYKRLFPHLVEGGKNGFKKNMCRKFGKYLDSDAVKISDPLKVFHSLRHTVITKLTNAGVNEGLKRALVGHDVTTITTAHDDYIHKNGLTMTSFANAINMLSYKTCDFDELKGDPNQFTAFIAKRIQQNQKMPSKKAKAITE